MAELKLRSTVAAGEFGYVENEETNPPQRAKKILMGRGSVTTPPRAPRAPSGKSARHRNQDAEQVGIQHARHKLRDFIC